MAATLSLDLSAERRAGSTPVIRTHHTVVRCDRNNMWPTGIRQRAWKVSVRAVISEVTLKHGTTVTDNITSIADEAEAWLATQSLVTV